MQLNFIKHHPLAAVSAAAVSATFLFGHVDPAAAATRRVTNCNNSGPGSLRATVAVAGSGDTIDLRSLTCGSILFDRAIRIDQNGLTLIGPGAAALALDGNHAGRLFFQPGLGTLSLQSLSLRNGRYAAPRANGGCISTAGNIELRDVWVHHCAALAIDTPFATVHDAAGGGLYALGSVSLLRSRVFANQATSSLPEFNSAAGGVFAGGDVSLIQSSVDDNAVSTDPYPREGQTGGILTYGRLTLYRSSIRHNRSRSHAGAFALTGFKATYSSVRDNEGGGIETRGDFELYHATVSGNRGMAIYALGGSLAKAIVEDSTIANNLALQYTAYFTGPVTLNNSTIAFNQENPGAGEACVPTVDIETNGTFQSSIVAANPCSAGQPHDVGTSFFEGQFVAGANNIIGNALISIPPDTLSVDPRLAPLADNGGPTATIALLSDSPAINRGNNTAGLTYDQRGPGFLRVKGSAPDIGAFER